MIDLLLMPTHLVNLDALIRREDFRASAPRETPSNRFSTLKASDLEQQSIPFLLLRKPDFQRETASWDPKRVAEFVESFVNGDLIPAIILWWSPSGNIFVIDGGHRLSAMIGWVHDDYGDGSISDPYFEKLIPQEQKEAAQKTKELINERVGSYASLKAAGANPPPELKNRIANLGVCSFTVQWVEGGADKAEASFLNINQRAAVIDKTELKIIGARRKPSGIAVRALIRGGTGHKYWSGFKEDVQKEIERTARDTYGLLFIPEMPQPIKSADLPVAGRGYSASTVQLLFDLVNEVNSKSPSYEDDLEGSQTLAYLRRVWRLTTRICGTEPGSLGLHPAVYFYSMTGVFQSASFLAAARWIGDLEARDWFIKFTDARRVFEEFLVGHKQFINQAVGQYGAKMRAVTPLVRVYETILNSVLKGRSDAEIEKAIAKETGLELVVSEGSKTKKGKGFSRETKTAAFLKDALENAQRCKICGARVHPKSISADHITRRQDGGADNVDNAQVAHVYCNTGYKEHLASRSRRA
jgi:Protein of unknown function DUF262/HNH endonuclease